MSEDLNIQYELPRKAQKIEIQEQTIKVTVQGSITEEYLTPLKKLGISFSLVHSDGLKTHYEPK